MFFVLIEKNYFENNRVCRLLDGILSVAKKKHEDIKIYTETNALPRECRVVIIICQSLKWSTDRIEELSRLGIHPLVFGFQYLDTLYTYSSIAPNYTKSAYRLTRHVLSRDSSKGTVAILGYNEDSLPDRLKYIGIREAVAEFGREYRVFKNHGDVLACLEAFSSDCDEVSSIIACNDNIAVMLYTRYKSIIENRIMCSCTGMKISEYLENPYPVCRIDYYNAGAQLANLYRFLVKEDSPCSTVMTFDMEFSEEYEPPLSFSHLTRGLYSGYEVDFYGDKNLSRMESLEIMLSECDSTDISILALLSDGETYEKIAEAHYLSTNAVKYRVKKMLDTVKVSSRRALTDLLSEYGLKFNGKDTGTGS